MNYLDLQQPHGGPSGVQGGALDALFGTVAQGVTQKRWLWLSGLILALLAAALGVARLRTDLSLRSYLAVASPTPQALVDYEKRWGADGQIAQILIEAEQGTVLSDGAAATLSTLTRALIADHEHVQEVFGLANAPLLHDELLSDELATLTPAQAAEVRTELRLDALLVPTWLSADARTAMILVRLRTADDTVEAMEEPLDAIAHAIQAAAGHGLRLTLTGAAALRRDATALSQRDQARLIPLSALLILGLLLCMFRSLRGIAVPLCTMLLTMLLLAGAMGLLGEPMQLLNQAALLLVAAIAVNDAIYLLHQFDRAAGDAAHAHAALPADPVQLRRDALRHALCDAGPACLLTALFTFISFASLYTSDMIAVRSFARVACIGVGIGFGVVMIAMPILLSFLPLSAPDHAASGFADAQAQRVARMLACLSRRRRGVIAFSMLLALSCAALSTRVSADGRILDLIDADHPVRRAMAQMDTQLGGGMVVVLELLADSPAAVQTPDALARLVALDGELHTIREVRAVLGPHSVIASLRGELRNADQLVDYLDTPGMSAFLTPDRRALRLLIGLPDVGGIRMLQIEADIKQRLARIFPEHTGFRSRLTGTAHDAWIGMAHISRDLAYSLASEFLVIALFMWLLTRSVRVATAVMLVNALPLLVGLGLLGGLGWQLSPGPAVLFATVLGLAVDDTVHLLVAAARRVQQGESLEHALEHTLQSSGFPVLVATLALLCVFLVQLSSAFPTLVVAAGVATAALSAGLLADLLLLPLLLLGPLRPRDPLRVRLPALRRDR